MNRDSDKIKSFGLDKIKSFDDFESKIEKVSNKYMRGILEVLASKGIHVGDIEEPDWGTDGMIELSENTTLTLTVVDKHKKMYCTLELPGNKFFSTEHTDSIDEALTDLDKLKKTHNINEADYTEEFKQALPRLATPFLKEQRSERVDKATRLVESAIEELKHIPKIDSMEDIPELIEKLQNILSDKHEHGLENLSKIYKKS